MNPEEARILIESEEVDQLDAECTKIYEEKSYVVPHSPNVNKIDELCMNILKSRFINA